MSLPNNPGLRFTSSGTVAMALGLLLMVSAGSARSESGLPPPNWQLVSDRNNIQVYQRHTDTSRLKRFRGVVTMTLPDEYAIVAAVNEYPSYPRWLYLFESAEELSRESPLRRTLYLTTDLPWPLKDRDLVMDIHFTQRITPRDESLVFEFVQSSARFALRDDFVRIPEMQGTVTFRRLDNHELEVTYEAVFDPGGYIPAWLVNVIASDIPHFTLDKLRRYLLRPELQDQYVPYLELMGKGRPADLMPARSYRYGFPPEQPLADIPLARMNELKRTSAMPRP